MEALMAASHLDPTEVTEDLKAFERRLTEFVTCLGPETGKWRLILAISAMCSAIGAWDFLTDEAWPQMSWMQLIWNHKFFALSFINIIVLFLLGIHRRVYAPNIILGRVRGVLNDYNMSCDDKGKLILKARPT